MDVNEFVVALFPTRDEVRQMMAAEPGDPNRFFYYSVITPCGRQVDRVAVLQDTRGIDTSMATVVAVTELVDENDIDPDEDVVQHYMNGSFTVEYDSAGELTSGSLELDPGTEEEASHPLFVNRPERVTIGL
jgi:hypothetical protein